MEFDFKTNSIKKFSETYNISIKTTKKYLDLFKIEYPKRKKSGVTLKRDRFGRFKSNFNDNNNQIERKVTFEERKIRKPRKVSLFDAVGK